MAKQKNTKKETRPIKPSPVVESRQKFQFEFKNESQRLAWTRYQQHDVLFLLGPAGTAKTFVSTAFAIKELANKSKKNIILTRPIVEAGEKLGFLPGDFNDKVDPYMAPLHDSICKIAHGSFKEEIYKSVQVKPIAFMRGATFTDSVCIFDEAQNATRKQLKLFLTRLGENSKMIITGDPTQCDLVDGKGDLMFVVERMSKIKGVGVITFSEQDIVRHPIVREVIRVLPD